MASISEQLLIDVRAWLKLATGIANDRVVPADDSGTRPDLPYLTVQFSSRDIRTQHAEIVRSLDGSGNLQENVIVHATATAQIDGYGRGADDLLSLAWLGLRTDRVRRELYDRKIGVQPTGSITDLSTLVDDKIEKRFSRDFTITYAYTLDTPLSIEDMQTFEGEFDFDDQNFEVIE